jgi:Predicted nucleotide-binding protein containing TIR-like domain
MPKPSVFVGSSTEGLEFARAVRTLLAPDAEVTLWNEGLFVLGSTFIETLVNSLPRFDFAIIVLTQDDWVSSRHIESFGPRDNVLFELGLFMGRLGRSRTFILHQSSSTLKIPTDLAGVTTATFDWPRRDSDYRSAVGPACDRMREAIRDLGVSETKVTTAILDLRSRQDIQEGMLSGQQAEIRWLKVALQGIVTQYELDKLVGLSREGPFLCLYSDDLFDELKRLRALGLVQNHDGAGVSVMRERYKDRNERFDLKKLFFITKRGDEYLRLREETMND